MKTTLHIAANYEYIHIIHLLLDHGASIHHQTLKNEFVDYKFESIKFELKNLFIRLTINKDKNNLSQFNRLHQSDCNEIHVPNLRGNFGEEYRMRN